MNEVISATKTGDLAEAYEGKRVEIAFDDGLFTGTVLKVGWKNTVLIRDDSGRSFTIPTALFGTKDALGKVKLLSTSKKRRKK